MQLAFRDAKAAIQQMDLGQKGILKLEDFYFHTQFFCKSATFLETLVLFKQLDEEKKRGYLTVMEL